MSKYEELKNVLDTAKNEHEIGVYLKENLDLIRVLNEHSWNCVIPRAEFAIGTKFRADFIILSACSGYWNCVLVEMQSPCDEVFKANGETSLQLREAIRQVQDWRMYIDTYEPAFREQLADLAGDKPAYCSNVEIHTRASTELRDPKTVIDYRYKILIGRRSSLNEDKNRRRRTFDDIEIVTFDRILDYAKRNEAYL